MRILHINSARAIGGGERHLADLVNALTRRGHKVYVALAPDSPVIRMLGAVPRENITELPLRNAADLPSALRLARFMRKHGIEIAHAHLARDYPLAAVAAHWANDLPLVITRHLLRPLGMIHRLTLARVARVIAPGEASARSLRQQKIFPEEKISVVVYGIDLAQFEQANCSFDQAPYSQLLPLNGHLLIGIAGELRAHKGQDLFLRAAATIAKRFPEARFVITGEDNSPRKEYRTHLTDLVVSLKLDQQLCFLGWLDSVAPFYGVLDVFVSASRVEPFGLVMVEAMASGTAVVATATDGAREIITDGITGKLAPIDDADGLAAAIISLLVNETERRRIIERARQVAHLRFSLERMTDETEEIYREVLQARSQVSGSSRISATMGTTRRVD